MEDNNKSAGSKSGSTQQQPGLQNPSTAKENKSAGHCNCIEEKCKPVKPHHTSYFDPEQMKSIHFHHVQNDRSKKPGQRNSTNR